MEYFRGTIKSTKGQKGKRQTALDGVYKGIEAEGAKEDTRIITQSKKLRAFRQFFVFVIEPRLN